MENVRQHSFIGSFMSGKKVFLGWERCQLFEDISIPRCFKCQAYYHKSNECGQETNCELCAENHDVRECPKTTKRCINCVNANRQFNTKYDESHEANNPECPTYCYYIEVLRSKIDYGQI